LLLVVVALGAGCQPGRDGSGAQNTRHSTVTRATHSTTNRLAREKSPYLLQHQHNPVDWHPWGEEAFARARTENKPIFLSIGYSTCHWCHVMERESFEDAEVARFLNDHFVNIKVDREERPDVDKIYMTFVQATTGSGGWPLNVFLTPDLKPFFGGTYFPPRGQRGRPGFLDVLAQVQRLWQERRGEVLDSANDLHRRLAQFVRPQPADDRLPGPDVLARAAGQLKAEYDSRHGGFGGAPKFPRPAHPAFLLRWARRAGDEKARRMVVHTCDRMAAGGMHDQLGGGFARYSVDAEWLVPHFEKMLYDNAQLAQLYLDAHLVSGEARYAGVVHGILRYVLRDMTHPDGGFYSAEDADSEGKEGKFYCWTLAELKALLAPDELAVATRYFGVTESGNFVDHSDPDPLPGQNVLHVADPRLTPAEAELLEAAKAKMLMARARRVRPHLDDKVLASWNGLMLGAFARAGVVLGEPAYLEAAARNLAFIQERLWDAPGRTLYHRWREGERDTAQLLDDYTFLLGGVLDLYEATLAPCHLEFALQLAEGLRARFHDPEHGGFWQAAPGAPDLILRVKEDYDGAEPSGNSVAALALLRLAEITGREEFRELADGTLRLFAERLRRLPQAMPAMLAALDFRLADRQRAVIAGGNDAAERAALLVAAHRVFAPNKVVLGNQPPAEPFACTLPAKDGRATAYICVGTTCRPPIQDPAELTAVLHEGR
jgi:hypothetical protein